MRSRLFPPVFVAAVLTMGFLAYNLYYAPFMKNLALWVFGVLVIYWFSVSGGMHNIIRGVPMYYPDQNGQVKVVPSSAAIPVMSGALHGLEPSSPPRKLHN